MVRWWRPRACDYAGELRLLPLVDARPEVSAAHANVALRDIYCVPAAERRKERAESYADTQASARQLTGAIHENGYRVPQDRTEAAAKYAREHP
jgi:hypothetical protein